MTRSKPLARRFVVFADPILLSHPRNRPDLTPSGRVSAGFAGAVQGTCVHSLKGGVGVVHGKYLDYTKLWPQVPIFHPALARFTITRNTASHDRVAQELPSDHLHIARATVE
jgi:hypothetical protein